MKPVVSYLKKRLFSKISVVNGKMGEVQYCKTSKGVQGVTFEGNNAVGSFCEFRGDIKVGYATTFGIHNLIAGDVEIGRYCQLAPYVSVNTYNHPQSHITTYINQRLLNGAMLQYKTSKKTVIGHDVWMGKNVIVLDGVHIGNGVIIAAGSIVTKDIPSYHIAAGIPAKVIKKRFPNKIIEELEALKWWDLNENEIKKIEYLFHKDLIGLESIYD